MRCITAVVLAASLFLKEAAAERVAVTIARRLAVPPAEARAAWLDYAWTRGGGLPLVASLASPDRQSRTVLPLLLRERLVDTGSDDELGYVLEDAGALRADVVAGSHSAQLRFAPGGDGASTDLTWSVEFETSSRNALWTAVTQSTVGEVVDNLEAFTAAPTVFTLEARLSASPATCVDAWLGCFRDGELGLPLPMLPPVMLDEGDSGGVGYERLILPPGLKERVLEVERGGDGSDGEECSARLAYTVANPAWRVTFPVHSHRGDVSFTSSADGGSRMRWTVSVRPMRRGAPLVRLLTETIVPAFARNLAARLEGAPENEEVTFAWS